MMAQVGDPHNKVDSPAADVHKLELLVEEICLLGCDAVNAIIVQIGTGQVPDLAQQLSAQQLQQLQTELEEIMAPLR